MYKNSNFFIISCKRALQYNDRFQYNETSLLEKIQLKVHLFACKPCTRYSIKNKKLSNLINRSGLEGVSKEEKETWQNEINQEITDQNS